MVTRPRCFSDDFVKGGLGHHRIRRGAAVNLGIGVHPSALRIQHDHANCQHNNGTGRNRHNQLDDRKSKIIFYPFHNNPASLI
jgi:hypothetical protein